MLTSTITAAKRAILSVGSGDGSQQASIVKSGHINIVSTFFESEQALIAKYGTAREHIALLRDKASTVLFEVERQNCIPIHNWQRRSLMLSSLRSLAQEYPTSSVGAVAQTQQVSKATNN